MGEEGQKQSITIHFADGNYVRTEIHESELDDEEQEFIEYVMLKLREPGHPHWAEIGSVIFYTQNVHAIAFDDPQEEKEEAA